MLSPEPLTRPTGQLPCSSICVSRPGSRRAGIRTRGPNIVMVVAGSFTLIDEHCVETQYGPGQGFATGLETHEAIAGSEGADYYSVYFLPAHATDLGTDARAPICARR